MRGACQCGAAVPSLVQALERTFPTEIYKSIQVSTAFPRKTMVYGDKLFSHLLLKKIISSSTWKVSSCIVVFLYMKRYKCWRNDCFPYLCGFFLTTKAVIYTIATSHPHLKKSQPSGKDKGTPAWMDTDSVTRRAAVSQPGVTAKPPRARDSQKEFISQMRLIPTDYVIVLKASQF